MALRSTLGRTKDFDSAHHVPELLDGFTDVFDSYIVPSGDLNLHELIGGRGPPLLLLGGWLQNRYAWRYLMLTLMDTLGFGKFSMAGHDIGM